MALTISDSITQLYEKVISNQQEILDRLDNIPAEVWKVDDRTVTDLNADAESSGLTQNEHDALFTVLSNVEDVLEKDNFKQEDRDKLNELQNTDITNIATKDDIRNIPTAKDIAISVWNTNDNKLLDKINNDLNTLMDFQMGNWAIENNQMVFYKRDGGILAKFNLKNKNRNPSETSIYYRELANKEES